MNGRTTTVGRDVIGTGAGASFATSLADPVVTVARSLVPGRFADFVGWSRHDQGVAQRGAVPGRRITTRPVPA